jgi:hypothetical protein
MHVPVHAVVQHTPSTHVRPLPHSPVEPHESPVMPRDAQWPVASQYAVASQAGSPLHVIAHIGAGWSAIDVHVTDG